VSTPIDPSGNKPLFSSLDASQPESVAPRHPLGLPAGSVRALLALMILGLIWALVVLQQTQNIKPPPIYLYYLMFLALGHFFAAHGKSIAGKGSSEPSPLHLPRGVIRTLLLLGFVAVFAWRYYKLQDFDSFLKLQGPSDSEEQPFLPFVLVGAFFLGILATHVVRLGRDSSDATPPWFQDVLAWISLLAMLGLAAEVIILVVINPTLEPERQLHMPNWQMALAAIISFYFGVRS